MWCSASHHRRTASKQGAANFRQPNFRHHGSAGNLEGEGDPEFLHPFWIASKAQESCSWDFGLQTWIFLLNPWTWCRNLSFESRVMIDRSAAVPCRVHELFAFAHLWMSAADFFDFSREELLLKLHVLFCKPNKRTSKISKIFASGGKSKTLIVV